MKYGCPHIFFVVVNDCHERVTYRVILRPMTEYFKLSLTIEFLFTSQINEYTLLLNHHAVHIIIIIKSIRSNIYNFA